MEKRLKKEVRAIEEYLEGLMEDFKAENQEWDKEYLYDEIRKYSNYKTALEQALAGFPTEVGSY